MEHCNEDTICKKIFSQDNCTDISFEYTLPDYYPDIRKSVHIFPSVRLSGAYINGDRVQYDMTVSFGFMYRAEDKTLQCAECKSEHSDFISFKKPNAVQADVIPHLQNINVRVADPRRISFKARICADVCVWGTEALCPELCGGVLSDEERQVLTSTVESADVSVSVETGVGVSEDIVIPREYPEAGRVITVYVLPQITHTQAQDGEISFRANVTGIAIYETPPDENGQTGVVFLPLSIPVSRIISASEVSEGCDCSSSMSVYDVTSNVSENAEGERRTLEIDFMYDVRTVCMCDRCVQSVSDMYSTAYETDAEYREVSTEVSMGTSQGSFTVSGGMSEEETSQLDGDIVCAFGKINDTSFSKNGKKLTVQGDLEVTCICRQGDEFGNTSLKIPFKGELDVPHAQEMQIYPLVSSGIVNVSYDGRKYLFTCEIYVRTAVTDKRTFTVLDKLTVTENAARGNASPFTLYYPSSDESAWDIAKKYKISTEALKKANPSLQGARVAVIPYRR